MTDEPASAPTNGASAPARARGSEGIEWQPIVGELFSMAHAWHRERVEAQRWTTLGAHVLVGIALVGATLLAWQGLLEGQAVAALFGATAGFLLAKAGARAI
jgi:hypothetical protein